MNVAEILRQAKAMQENLKKLQEELGARTVTASSGGGMVSVTCNGRQEVCSIVIEKGIVDPDDVDMLQDLVVTAVNEALRQAREMAAGEMRRVAGGLGGMLPGDVAGNLSGLFS